MKKDETAYKRELMLCARSRLPMRYVPIRIEDHFTHGYPDIWIVGNKKLSVWEAKLADPDFKTKGIQTDMMKKLAIASYARFVVWYVVGNIKITYVVHPAEINNPRETWESWVEGIDHDFVVDIMELVHT